MENELKAEAEEWLGCEIPEWQWEDAKTRAEEKLARIIQREGDANGERKKPYYLAKLIVETIRSDLFEMWCFLKNEDKKRAAHKVDNPHQQPHYSIPFAKSQDNYAMEV